jgi:glutamine synthetase
MKKSETIASSARIRMLFCDHLNLARGKYIPAPASKAAGAKAHSAARFCRGVFGVAYDRELIPAPGAMVLEGLPDLEAKFDASQLRQGWEPDTQVVVSDLYDTFGEPLPMCGRGALKRAIAAWNKLGYQPMVGIELEAFAFQVAPDGKLVPYDTPSAHVYSTGHFADPLGFTDAIWHSARRLGFPLESMHSEYDSPQFEFTLTYADALRAVDDSFLFRLMAREIAAKHGIVLSFMPKPILDVGGSGVHVNFSLKNKAGKNQISGGHDTAKMNPLTKACIAGLMHHHCGMSALVAPSVNSYQRLKPATLSGFWQNWGVDHRSVTLRVSAEVGPAARLEHRMGDGAANPYTLVATVLQAARLGVVNKYPLQSSETGDGLESVDTKVGVGESLSAALDDLEADLPLREAVGELLVNNHVYMKRNEIEKVAKLEGDAARDFYLRRI